MKYEKARSAEKEAFKQAIGVDAAPMKSTLPKPDDRLATPKVEEKQQEAEQNPP